MDMGYYDWDQFQDASGFTPPPYAATLGPAWAVGWYWAFQRSVHQATSSVFD